MPAVAGPPRWRRKSPSHDAASAATALIALAVAARAARRAPVGRAEEALFRAVNRLGAAIHRPLWVVMQAGSFPAIGVAAAALRRRNPRAALAAGGAGFASWLLAKLVKRLVGRGRPVDHLSDVVVRGAPQRGRGFPSGHAAVVTALVTVGGRTVPPVAARAGHGIAIVVGLARQYVGAHLPVDVAGGFALGSAAGALANLVVDLGRPARAGR